MAETLVDLIGETPPEAAPQAPAATPEPVTTAVPAAAATPSVEPQKPTEAQKPEHGYAPIPALLDEREKRQKAESKSERLERELAELRRQHEQAPSVPNEPEQLAAYLAEQNERAIASGRFDVSEIVATQSYGKETVDKAKEWGMERSKASPAFAREYFQQQHPIDWAVRQYKRDQTLSEMGDDEPTQKAWIEKRARELGLIPNTQTPSPQSATAPAAPQPAPVSKPVPAPSLASAPSAGGMGTPVYEQPKELKQLFG